MTMPTRLDMPMLIELKRSANELSQIETPWEPFDEIVEAFAHVEAFDLLPRTTFKPQLPWRLYEPFLKVLRHAADTSSPGNAGTFVDMGERLEKVNALRPAVDRLADLGAT